MDFDIEMERILFSEEQLKNRVREMGEEMTRDYAGKNPLFIGVLKGAVVFFSDLIRSVGCELQIEFVRVSSYVGKESSNDIKVSELPKIKGRDVVIVEDILDTARTLSKLKELMLKKEPNSLKIAALLDKPSRRVVDGFRADYTGFVIDDWFVVGYGLDCDEKYRNLPYIGVI